MTNKIYSNIFEVIEKAEAENNKMKAFCNTTPEPRKTIYQALFSTVPDKFYRLKMPSGEIRLVPYQPSFWLFRGENDDYGKCTPSLYRNEPSEMDLLIARVKEIQFETILLDHPAVIDIIKSGLNINFKGLAQHYSLKTDLLNLT